MFHLAHLACPTIADDSLAHQGVSDVGQGGRKCCDGLRRTPGMVRGFVLPGSEQITAAYFRLPSTSGTGSGCIGASTSSSSSFFFNSFHSELRFIWLLSSNKSQTLTLVWEHHHYTRAHIFGRTCVPKSRPGRRPPLLINTFTRRTSSMARPRTLDSFPTFFFITLSLFFCVFTVLRGSVALNDVCNDVDLLFCFDLLLLHTVWHG